MNARFLNSINRESEQEKTLFDQILSNSIGRTEGDMEKKLRETGEWIIDQTEGSSRATGKPIIHVFVYSVHTCLHF